MHATDIVGYDFNAEHWCPDCLLNAFGNVLDRSAEDVLDREARALNINRHDERSFDQSEFPKVIFASQVDSDERCCKCHNSLIGA